MGLAALPEIFKKSVIVWFDTKAPTMGAALAYYTGFSIVPLLVVGLAISSSIFGVDAAHDRLTRNLNLTLGPTAAAAVEDVLRASSDTQSSSMALGFGSVILLFGASGVFAELQNSLNTIWQLQARPGRGIWGMVCDRLLSFGMVLATCFVLLTSLAVTALLTYLASAWTPQSLSGGVVFWQVANQLLSFIVITILFGLIYRFVPDAQTAWSDIWVGAAVTSFLFSIGKYALGLYLSISGMATAYGAAGSLAALLFWVYYSAQIFLFGAALTRVYAQREGAGIQPNADAESIPGSVDTEGERRLSQILQKS